jgi:hypothetical protein
MIRRGIDFGADVDEATSGIKLLDALPD